MFHVGLSQPLSSECFGNNLSTWYIQADFFLELHWVMLRKLLGVQLLRKIEIDLLAQNVYIKSIYFTRLI